ncbi:DUF4922 domain-containing protein [Alphaproteobacteria bacterium]|nr:DUF4922 domain-containing protein [Alphaproteobacteria bacterium]
MDYETEWANLNKKLREIERAHGSLGAALSELETHQRESGFIKGDLQGIERVVFSHPERKNHTLRAQINPRRAKRHDGSGAPILPNRYEFKNDGCFLCSENIKWQQQQRQIGFEITASSGGYNALMNPFPLLPNHVVFASKFHIPQEFSLLDQKMEAKKLEDVLRDLCQLALRLPDHIGFYNGVGAGASIPGHFHFQFFNRAPDFPSFPIEERDFTTAKNVEDPELIVDYPIKVLRWQGNLEKVVSNAVLWISKWIKSKAELSALLSTNFITTAGPSHDEITLYFVPRDKSKQFWNGNRGIVGGLEVLGELVMASEDELALIEKGVVNYQFIQQALSAVSMD